MQLSTPLDTADATTRTLTFERLINATPEAVFDAWTQPEQVALWWDPDGRPLTTCTIDLRPGGAFEFAAEAHGHPFTGTYVTVSRPYELAFDALGAHGVVSLRGVGAQTHMRVTIRCASAEHFAMFVSMGVAAGTSRTLDNLVERF